MSDKNKTPKPGWNSMSTAQQDAWKKNNFGKVKSTVTEKQIQALRSRGTMAANKAYAIKQGSALKPAEREAMNRFYGKNTVDGWLKSVSSKSTSSTNKPNFAASVEAQYNKRKNITAKSSNNTGTHHPKVPVSNTSATKAALEFGSATAIAAGLARRANRKVVAAKATRIDRTANVAAPTETAVREAKTRMNEVRKTSIARAKTKVATSGRATAQTAKHAAPKVRSFPKGKMVADKINSTPTSRNWRTGRKYP